MEITYTLTPDDVVAFHRFQVRHSPAWRRSILTGIGTGVISAAVLFIIFRGWESWINAVFPVAFPIVYIALYPISVYLGVGRSGLNMVRDGKNKGLWGPHALAIDESGVRESTEVGESSVKWQGVERVAASPSHLYIFTGSNAAHVIPRRAFAEPQQADQFFHQAQAYFESARLL